MADYLTINGASCAETEEKRSRFISNISFVDTDEAALSFIAAIKKQHSMANHNVYAYVLREGTRARSSDDGEPAKTAGLPVLDVLRHANIVDCVIVVTRYFGGTLLGTGGLVRAYSSAAKAALDSADIVKISECIRINTFVDYALYEQATRLIAQNNARLNEPIFAENVSLCFTILCGTEKPLLQALQELTHGKAVFDVSVPFFLPF